MNVTKRQSLQEVQTAEYEGEIPFGDMMIPCAVLAGGVRVLSERGVAKGFGIKRSSASWQDSKRGGVRLPSFCHASNLNPFISNELRSMLIKPILYHPVGNSGMVAHGVLASAIPQICDVWLKARDAGVLRAQQAHIAVRADIVIRGLAHTGIIALVDEATGYQSDRSRDALAMILQEFISKELCRWAKRFPDEFYQQLARLRGIDLSTVSTKKPQYIGHLTNNVVYSRLAPGVLDELKQSTPKDEEGRRRHHFHRLLTEDVGHPRLAEHIAAVLALMRVSTDWQHFSSMLDESLPVWTPQMKFPGM